MNIRQQLLRSIRKLYRQGLISKGTLEANQRDLTSSSKDHQAFQDWLSTQPITWKISSNMSELYEAYDRRMS